MDIDGPGSSLTHAESLARLSELAERGLWRVGRDVRGRTHLSVHRRVDAYFLLNGGPTTSAGFRTFRRDLPAALVQRTAATEVLGRVTDGLLEALDLRPEEPVVRGRFPVLKQAKVRSWLELVKTSATVDVIRLGRVFVVGTWVVDRRRLDGHQVPGEHGHAVLIDPSASELGGAIQRAADAVQP